MKNKRSAYKILGLIINLFITNLVSTYIVYKTPFFWKIDYASNFIQICLFGTILISILIYRIKKFTILETFSNIFGVTTAIFGLMIAIIAFSRTYYSRSFIFYDLIIFLMLQFIFSSIIDNPKKRNYYIANWGIGKDIYDCKKTNWKLLTDDFEFKNCDGVIIDFQEKIDDHWMRFISNLSLTKIPIFYAASIYENLFSKVSLKHLNEGLLTSYLKNNSIYKTLKRIADLIISIMLIPILILVISITAVIMKIESNDTIFYSQKRVGKNGKLFTMYKLRTMKAVIDKDGNQNFTKINDNRVTKLGRVLRKYRIDELPQFLNIFKGEMSLIGPRPEQEKLSHDFEAKIPFYNYRNSVNPGITGWAQVNYGYAASHEETMEKLSYDLYYVKNLSIRLDLKIVFKTIRTILTGFGHR